jgi:hypothetical protein
LAALDRLIRAAVSTCGQHSLFFRTKKNIQPEKIVREERTRAHDFSIANSMNALIMANCGESATFDSM